MDIAKQKLIGGGCGNKGRAVLLQWMDWALLLDYDVEDARMGAVPRRKAAGSEADG